MDRYNRCSDEQHDSIRDGLNPSLSELYDELAEAVSKLPLEGQEKLMEELESGEIKTGDTNHGREDNDGTD